MTSSEFNSGIVYLAKKISTNLYYLSLLFQLSVAYSENFKEIKA